jgi:thioredoxin-like negative regulator of GroEL
VHYVHYYDDTYNMLTHIWRTGVPDMTNFSANLSDLDCKERLIRPIAEEDIRQLAMSTKLTSCSFASADSARQSTVDQMPLNIDDEIHWDEVLKNNKDTLFVLIFYATWCGACRSLNPLLRKLALRTPTARFVRVDIDCMHRLATRLQVKTLPTIKVIRSRGEHVTKDHVLGTLQEVDELFVSKLLNLIASASTPEEVVRMNGSSDNTEEQMETLTALSRTVAVGAEDLTILSSRPLESLTSYICYQTAKAPTKTPTLDVSRHAAAQSAVAQSMLKRMKDDVVSHLANETPTPKLNCLTDEVLQDMFAAADSAARRIATQQCIEQVEELLQKLQHLRTQDTDAILGISHISNTVINYIDLSCGGFEGRLERSKFVLRRAARQAAEVWPEFLFAAILSSKGELDMEKFNPYLPKKHIDVVLQLVMLQMLRANRLGHLSRCIGAVIVLLKLLREALDATPAQSSFPKFLQAADDVASIIAAGRHFVSTETSAAGGVTARLDPRFLIFEFTWNLLLRKKQVDIGPVSCCDLMCLFVLICWWLFCRLRACVRRSFLLLTHSLTHKHTHTTAHTHMHVHMYMHTHTDTHTHNSQRLC